MFGVIDGGLAGVRGSAPMRNTLLEREFEVRALERALDELARGRGGVVSIESAVSLGKTALLQQAGELAVKAGFALLSARGAELEREFTFGVVRQLFESALPGAGEDRERLLTGAARAMRALSQPAMGPAVLMTGGSVVRVRSIRC